MEICRGNVLLFLTMLICSTCVVAQTDPSTSAPTAVAGTSTAMLIDYCASAPCIHGNCSDDNTTNYVCNCATGFTGTNCENKLVLFPDFKKGGRGTVGYDPDTYVMRTLIPFPYFDRTVGYLYASERGYVSFGQEYYRVNAPIGTEWPYVPSLFGVYWTDMQVYRPSRFWAVQDYMMRNVTESSPLVEYVKNIINEPNFEPLFITMLTWPGMHPIPGVNYPNDTATVQLILTTDSQFSYAIKSYQTVFGNTGVAGRPLISTDYTRENGARATGAVPKNITGPLLMKLFTTGTPNKQPFDCVKKVQDVKSRLGDAIQSLPVCPRHLVQATTDGWFQVSSTSPSCYLSILSDAEGLQQKCCYNRFRLLIANTTEAGVPVQVNASGITLQAAFDQCCTVMPQLCMWFYQQFPTRDSRLYVPPFIAGTFGSMHFFTFDDNKYTFFGVGDFILFKSGNTQVQMRAQKNVATNTSSTEALAVQIADNTSNVQFYLTADNFTWNLNPGQRDTLALGTYRIQQSESSSTLMLQSVIITATNTMGVLSYTIRTNLKNPKSGGLLGSTSRKLNNNLKYRNGTKFNDTTDQLTTSQICSFAQSWKVQNVTETLFNYPGARPFDDAKNDEGFTPLEYPTTANETLRMYTEANRTVESEEAVKLCRDELFCLQEYFLSNSKMSAARVLEETNNISFQKQQSRDVPDPKFQYFSSTYRIDVKTMGIIAMSINIWDESDAEFYAVKDELPNISASFSSRYRFVWDITADLAKLRAFTYPRNLKFYVTYASNISDVYIPTFYLCLCEQTSQCDSSKLFRGPSHSYMDGDWDDSEYMVYDDVVTDGNVKNMMCNCNGTAGGKFCEKKLDICLNCYNHTACDVSKVNYCAPCPAGFEGDGKLCLDIDECSVNNGGCDHDCTNTEGSFTCSCLPGYTQNGPKCIDINECLLNTNLCNDALKMCINLPGTYTCSCFRGLVGDRCIRAPYAFTGALDLANSGNQRWSIRLTDTNSNEFKDLSGKVARSIMSGLTNGNVGTNNNSYVEVLSFRQVQNPSRTKRQAIPSNLHILARYVIYTASGNLTADTLNNALRNYKAPSCNTSCQFGEIILYSDAPKVDSIADLCSYPQIHKCDTSTSFCTQLNQTTSCDCKTGFAYSTQSESCRDIDECAGNSTKTCPETGVCMNTFGSYECECSAGRIWKTNTSTCVADICSTNPCKNDGACVALHNRDEFVCKCSYGWEGQLCDDEDSEAQRMKVAVICVGVILGVSCLVLLVALIVVCRRQGRTLDDGTYTSSRHNEVEHLPRAKISHTSDTETTEHGQGNGYKKLNYGQPDEKSASKNVYENRTYEDDLSERL